MKIRTTLILVALASIVSVNSVNAQLPDPGMATAAAIVAEGNGYESALVNFRFIANTVWTTKQTVQNINGVK